jgi:methylenetetrahydrofolate dehydrogenase (NADP+)/methenyltetrahydrofolate cyclohydrolase
VVLAGDDPASAIYVRNKERSSAEAGIASFPHRLPADVPQDDLEALVRELNADPAVDGVLVQLPLPRGLDKQAVLDLIDPAKDVDGFHPVNIGRLALGLPGLMPCTPAGVIELLRRHEIKTSGMRAVVIGRSSIVGRPMALMLSGYGDYADATVTVVHTRTPKDQIPEICRGADLIVAAAGVPRFVQADWVREGAVVVDVGMHRTPEGLVGDVDYANVKDKCLAITPVPGGIGPMTIAMLMRNTVAAYKAHVGEG